MANIYERERDMGMTGTAQQDNDPSLGWRFAENDGSGGAYSVLPALRRADDDKPAGG